jgi:hypothetical protein
MDAHTWSWVRAAVRDQTAPTIPLQLRFEARDQCSG